MSDICIFNISTQIEHQIVRLERARAVLNEVENRVSDYPAANLPVFLMNGAAHLNLLVQVTDEYLCKIIPALSRSVNDLINISKSEKKTANEQKGDKPHLDLQAIFAAELFSKLTPENQKAAIEHTKALLESA